jgi:nucleotide-binding universal stress UspA family protein
MTTILLAIDAPPGKPLQHVNRAIEMAAQLIRDKTDHVIVMHVREFSLARLARTMRDEGGAPGRLAVHRVVAEIRASAVIREADTGHVAQTILAAAAEFDAGLIILGTREDTNLPRTPLDMATHLLHMSTLPVLIVPTDLGAETVCRAPATATST